MPTPLCAWDFQSSNVDYVNGISPASSGTTAYTAGKYGQGFSFKNSVTTSDTPTYYLVYTLSSYGTTSSTGFSISFWFNQTDKTCLTSYQALIAWTSTSGSYYFDPNVTPGANGTISFYGQNPAGAGLGLTIPSSISPIVGAWYHVAFIVGGGLHTMYVNGSQYGTGTYPNEYTLNQVMAGRTGQYSGHALAGTMDDLRVYNTVLTAAQVKAIYNQQGMPGRAVQTNTQVPIASMIGQTFTPANISSQAPDTSVAGQISLTVAANNNTNQGKLYLTPSTTGVSFSIVYKLNSDTTNAGGPVCLLSDAGDCLQLNMAFNLTSLVLRKFPAGTASTFASTTVTSSGVTIYATCVLANNGYIYLYVNGSLVSSDITNTLQLPNKPYSVFLGKNRFSNLVDVTIWDFFLVNATLSASRVADLYQKQLANINYNPGNTINWIPAYGFHT